jgi:hypothetical protein
VGMKVEMIGLLRLRRSRLMIELAGVMDTSFVGHCI